MWSKTPSSASPSRKPAWWIWAASLAGQLAVVTGLKDVSAAAKVVKTFAAEFTKPKIKFGYLKNQRLETDRDFGLG